MASFIATMSTILILISLGYLLKRLNLLKITDIETLNKIVVKVAMPCMVFFSLYKSDLSNISSLALMPFIGLIVAFSSGLIIYTILSIKKYPKKEKWSILIPITMGNTAFLGFPLIMGVFGDSGLIRAIFYDMSSMIVFLSLSFILSFIFEGTFKEALKKALTFPTLWALILGISINLLNISIGDIAINVIEYLSAMTIPLIMISLGLSLQFKGLKENFKIAILGSTIKLLINPLIAFFMVIILGLSNIEFVVPIVEAAMPSGMLAIVLAVTYDLDFKLTADCSIIITLFSLMTLSVIIAII